MVLSDIDIRAEIAARRLTFDPPIDDPDERIDSSAVDLLLHEELILLPDQQVQGVTIVPRGCRQKSLLQIITARSWQMARYDAALLA